MHLLLSNISIILNTVIRLIYVYINIHVYVSIFIVIFSLVLIVKASIAFFRELLNYKLCNVMVNMFTFHWIHICQSAAMFCVFWLKTGTWNFLSITFKLLSVFICWKWLFYVIFGTCDVFASSDMVSTFGVNLTCSPLQQIIWNTILIDYYAHICGILPKHAVNALY